MNLHFVLKTINYKTHKKVLIFYSNMLLVYKNIQYHFKNLKSYKLEHKFEPE